MHPLRQSVKPLDDSVAPPREYVPTVEGREGTVLDVVERALEQEPEAREGWLVLHCPDGLLHAARRILRMAEVTNADEDVTLALLTGQKR